VADSDAIAWQAHLAAKNAGRPHGDRPASKRAMQEGRQRREVLVTLYHPHDITPRQDRECRAAHPVPSAGQAGRPRVYAGAVEDLGRATFCCADLGQASHCYPRPWDITKCEKAGVNAVYWLWCPFPQMNVVRKASVAGQRRAGGARPIRGDAYVDISYVPDEICDDRVPPDVCGMPPLSTTAAILTQWGGEVSGLGHAGVGAVAVRAARIAVIACFMN